MCNMLIILLIGPLPIQLHGTLCRLLSPRPCIVRELLKQQYLRLLHNFKIYFFYRMHIYHVYGSYYSGVTLMSFFVCFNCIKLRLFVSVADTIVKLIQQCSNLFFFYKDSITYDTKKRLQATKYFLRCYFFCLFDFCLNQQLWSCQDLDITTIL